MRILRKGVDDAHTLFYECIGFIDNAERCLAACHIGKRGTHVLRGHDVR